MHHTSSSSSVLRKSRNVLLDRNWRAKVSDFSLSREDASTGGTTTAGADIGTPAWTAPEYLQQKTPFNEKCDVYSFGIVMWEIITRRLPWAGASVMQILTAKLQGQQFPVPEDSGAPEELLKLMTDCWALDADARPTFAEIVHRSTGIKDAAAVSPAQLLRRNTDEWAEEQRLLLEQRIAQRRLDSSSSVGSSTSSPSRSGDSGGV